MENERNELVTTENEMATKPYDDRCEVTDESNSSGGILDTVIKFSAGVVMGVVGTIVAIRQKRKKEQERKAAEDKEVMAEVAKMHCDGIKKAKEESDKVVVDEELEYFEEQKESKKKK